MNASGRVVVRLGMLAAVVLVATVSAPLASAASVDVWPALVGPFGGGPYGVNGSATMRLSGATGTLRLDLKNLTPSTPYPVRADRGTCDNAGGTALWHAPVRTSTASGRLSATFTIPTRYVARIREGVAHGPIVLLIGRGGSLLCARFSGLPSVNSCVAKAPHRVVAGDTFSEIARSFGLTVDALLAANPKIRDPNRIAIGELISIPRIVPSRPAELTSDPGVAAAINNRGEVVGSSGTSKAARRAFLWQNGTLTDLGTLGGSYSDAHDINDRRQIVGSAQTASGAIHAFLWQNGAMTDLGTLGGRNSGATSINERGQIVGWSELSSGLTRASLWQDGTMTELGTLGGTHTWATAIASNGDIVGTSEVPSGKSHAVLWRSGAMIDLHVDAGKFGPGSGWDDESGAEGISIGAGGRVVGWLTDGAGGSYGFDWLGPGVAGILAQPSSFAGVNERGFEVGWRGTRPADHHAIVLRAATAIDLGDPYGAWSEALAINECGEIVGTVGGSEGDARPFFWPRDAQ